MKLYIILYTSLRAKPCCMNLYIIFCTSPQGGATGFVWIYLWFASNDFIYTFAIIEFYSNYLWYNLSLHCWFFSCEISLIVFVGFCLVYTYIILCILNIAVLVLDRPSIFVHVTGSHRHFRQYSSLLLQIILLQFEVLSVSFLGFLACSWLVQMCLARFLLSSYFSFQTYSMHLLWKIKHNFNVKTKVMIVENVEK